MGRNSATGYAMVALAATLFAINGTVSKVILGSGIDSQQLTEVRCAGALVGLMLIALATRPDALPLRREELPLIVALGVGGLAIVQWSYFFAIHRLEIGIALVIQFVGPILVALWARFVYHERVRARIWLALALALAGLTLMVELWQSDRPDTAADQRNPRRDRRHARAGARDLHRLGPAGGNAKPGASVRNSRYSRRRLARLVLPLTAPPLVTKGATLTSPLPSQKRLFVVLLVVLAVLVPASGAQARGLTPAEASLFKSMNAARKSNGLPALRVDFHLVRAARGHSADMMRRQYFAHGSVLGRAAAAGARGPLFGEDLAWATDISATWVVTAWLASPAHRANLLRPGFRRVGIGYAFGNFIGHGGAGVVTADFAGR